MFKTGSFDLRTTTGTATYAHGLSQAPKAMIFFQGWGGSNSYVPSGSVRTMDEIAFSIGFTDGTDGGSVGYGASSYSNPAGSSPSFDTNGGVTRLSNGGLMQAIQADKTTISQANFSAWDTTNVTLNWITASSVGTGKRWHFVSIGGGKVQAKVVHWTLSASTTATTLSQSVSVGWKPNTCLHLSSQSEYDAGISTGTKRDDAVISFGAADWFGSQWAVMNYAEQRAQPTDVTDVYHMYNSSNILLYRANSGGNNLHKRVTHTGWTEDGFSVDIITASAGNLSDDTRVISLCLQGVNSFAGVYTKSTSTTTGTHAHVMTTNTTRRFTPGVVIFSSDESTNNSQTAPSSKANFHIGAAASTTTEQSVNISAEDGGNEHMTYDSKDDLVLIKENSYDATETQDQTEAEAALSSFNSDGFTLNWTKADSQANLFQYLALGTPYGTDVKLESFEVVSDERGRTFRWRTGYESGSLGFHIYDDDRGNRRRLTTDLIAGSALLVGVGQPLTTGQSYQWRAGPDLASTQYWLEELSIDGKRTQYGPFTARRGSSSDVATISSPLLSDLGQGLSLRAASDQALSARDELPAPLLRSPPPANLAQLPGMKLMVRREGLYRVSAERLLAAGLDGSVDPRLLRLFTGGYEVRLRVIGEEDGRLDPGDAIEFHGLPNDTLFTEARTYWLTPMTGAGVRLGRAVGAPQRPFRVSSFPFAVEHRPRSIYFAALLNGEENNFYGPVVSDKGLDQRLTVHHLGRTAGASAQLRVRLHGASETTHRVSVRVNGQPAGDLAFAGRKVAEATFELPAAALLDGENVVGLATGDPDDVVLVDSLRLVYPHALVADGDAQRVTLPARRGVKLEGFTTEAVRAFDVTHPDAVTELPITVAREGDTFSAVASPLRDGGTVLFVGEPRLEREVPLVKNHPSSWSGPQPGADLYIITHGSLASAAEPLRRLREQQGLVVQVVDVEDLYDEFNHGEKNPKVIRDFLKKAHGQHQRRPRFALLFGDASFDPRDHLGLGDHDLVPTKLVDTWPLETASDDWFGDFLDSGVSEVAIGRIPARTPELAGAVVDKLVRYAQTGLVAGGGALVVGDQNTMGTDFEAAARAAAAALEGTMPVSLRLRGQLSPMDPPTVFDALNLGPSLVQYFGHGSVDLWNGVLSADKVGNLENEDRLALVVSLTCLNGFFQDPRMTTMAEALLGAARGGAVAVWSSSGYTNADDHPRLGEIFVRGVLREGLTLGEAARQAKLAINDLDVRRTWLLFGDPSQTFGSNTIKLQAQPDGVQAMGCQLSGSTASPFGVLLLAAVTILLRRRRRR